MAPRTEFLTVPHVGELHRQLAWRQIGMIERECDDAIPDIVGDTVPHP